MASRIIKKLFFFLYPLILAGLWVLSFQPAHCQKLIESRQTSYLTYIYKLTDKEAKKIYRNELWGVDPSFFHTLVDSFPTYSKYTGTLLPGHYLKTYSEKNKQKYSITTVQHFDVFILNNNTDLCLQVYDSSGNPVTDAGVRIRGKKVRFNEETQTYRDKKSNRKGVLEVSYDGFTAYYDLVRDHNNSGFRRGSRTVLYSTPVKYVWIPVKFIILLPIDAVRSLVYWYPFGTINRTQHFFARSYHSIACIFDSYDCDSYHDKRFKLKHTGYIVFNKPKYLPGDTVKFKAFLLTNKGKPIDKPIEVVLNSGNKDFKLFDLSPYRKGGYTGEFYLHDSLEMQLDKYYYLTLQHKNCKHYLNGNFRYEDYELSKNKLTLRTESQDHYRNKEASLYIKGTDENDLNLQDARIEILLKPDSISEYFARRVFIPDTLLFHQKKLEPGGETLVLLPDSAFPEANFKYKVLVKLYTSDNEVTEQSTGVYYYHFSEEFNMEVLDDSIQFFYVKNGEPDSTTATIGASDNLGNASLVYEGVLPGKISLNPYFSRYTIKSDSLSETISLSSFPALLQCFSARTCDSVFIHVDNPRGVPFTYDIYRKNERIFSGFEDSLNLKLKSGSKQNYYLSVRYIWGGVVKNETYRIPLNDKELSISVIQPGIVYPGQKSQIELLVKDYKGKAVEGVDLTAFALTKKFNYAPPELPETGKNRKDKALINNFDLNKIETRAIQGFDLDYEAWKLLAGIDSIEYYRFSYPGNSIYRFEYQPADSLTQFAPFVFHEGKMQDIHVIYVDSKPVYFSWSTNFQPYSFKIKSGYHQVKLRTGARNITIDSLYFPAGNKLIFSLNEDFVDDNVKHEIAKSELSAWEQGLLYKYILPYRNSFGERFAYIEGNDNIQLLTPNSQNNRWGNVAGPFSGQLTFQLMDSYSTSFTYEPFFEYEFAPGLLKMRTLEETRYPRFLGSYHNEIALNDLALTKKSIDRRWAAYLDLKRYNNARYYNPSVSPAGTGRLLINRTTQAGQQNEFPLNILVFRCDDAEFLRIYPGNTSTIYSLREGYHKLLFFYPGSKYYIEDSVLIHKDGLNYLETWVPQEFIKDTFSLYVSRLIEENIFKPAPYSYQEKNETREIYRQYQNQYQYTGEGYYVEGIITDASTGEALPFVNIVVKGYNYGTNSDFDGKFKLKVPVFSTSLLFTYIGYDPLEIQLDNREVINVALKASSMSLQEVVVTSYSIPRMKASLAYSVGGVIYEDAISSEVSVQYMRGAMASLPGVAGVQVLETSSRDPLLITQDMGRMDKGAVYDDDFFQAASGSSSIRDNFSDYAFWEPVLITDKDGKAGFDVTFPDDVTRWETFYLAMTDRQHGQTQSRINSYKPLMAQLSVPRFLVSSDTAFAIGKVLNYTPDTADVKTSFEINGETRVSLDRPCVDVLLDTLLITAMDSVTVTYSLEKPDGYFDGETRDIPVFPIGLEETRGNFYVLDHDTTLKVFPDTALGEVTLYAKADILEVIEDEINHVVNYRYLCNEQIASKLKALLSERNITLNKGIKFSKENDIEKMVRLLTKGQEESGLWGWWKGNREIAWISLHVVEALVEAEKAGFKMNIDKGKLIEQLVWEMENSTGFDHKLRILKILHLIGAQVRFQAYITELEKPRFMDFNGLLRIIELKQACKLDYDPDTIFDYQKSTLFGGIYFSDADKRQDLQVNDIQNTLIAYRILRADSSDHTEILRKIRNYFFENRNTGYWRNTYESAQIIETILPDLLDGKAGETKSSLLIQGDINDTISIFPWEMKINPDQHIEVTKTGDFPVYFTSYQRYWNSSPKAVSGDFAITTRFAGDSDSFLTAGKQTKLFVDVVINKDARYVMINVPIPGGCSYTEKKNNFRNEAHREYFKNETAIFCENLSEGSYTFEINLTPRYTGTYTLNPAKIELMYFPTYGSNNELKKIRIKE